MQFVTVLGSTGSIGKNTLDVISQNKDKYKIYALTAASKIDVLAKQCIEFNPEYAVVGSAELAEKLNVLLYDKSLSVKVISGEVSLKKVASDSSVDIVMSAIVGIAGLAPTYSAILAGKKILLANKESLVTAGHIFMQAVKNHRATLLPVDSEHNAIFQCMSECNYVFDSKKMESVIITASGGPFRLKTEKELNLVTPAEACSHPNWKMGPKISVDSATMVNKALEVIEAYWLFDIPVEKIEVIIHPQSIIHSMVKYNDGSYIAQMGSADMRIPISNALHYPNRFINNTKNLDLTEQTLTFEKLDLNRFEAIKIALDNLAKKDYSANIIFNAANEALVALFLDEKIGFNEILLNIKKCINELHFMQPENIDDIFNIDNKTREYIKKCIKK